MTNVSHRVYVWGQQGSPRYTGELKEILSYIAAQFDVRKTSAAWLVVKRMAENKLEEKNILSLTPHSRLDRKKKEKKKEFLDLGQIFF